MTKVTEKSPNNVDIFGDQYVKKYAKQMLKNSLFIGTFQEKRFVESLNDYRDVISIGLEEEEFIKNLQVVENKIRDSFLKLPWVGITGPNTIGAPVGFNLWVTLPEEVFGKYWYRVKTVEFLENEIRLKLEILRPVQHEHTPLRNILASKEHDDSHHDSFDLKEMLLPVQQSLLHFYLNMLTFQNIKQSVIFISLLISTIIAGGANIIKYLLEYLLKLIRETSNLIKAVTPIIITCLNLILKIIFGFYHMIVTMWKGKSIDQPVYNTFYNIDPQLLMLQDPRQRYNKYFNKSLPYPSRRSPSGVTITPLDD